MIYKLLSAKSAELLEEIVNSYLSEGWILHGFSIVVPAQWSDDYERNSFRYLQAVIFNKMGIE